MRYLLVGSVVEKTTGHPLPALRVMAFDGDRKMDHQVGQGLTADDGSFHMWFLEDQFQGAGCKKDPALHIRVADERGNELFRTRGPVPMSVIEKDHFQIELPEAPPGKKGMTQDANLRPEHCFSWCCQDLLD